MPSESVGKGSSLPLPAPKAAAPVNQNRTMGKQQEFIRRAYINCYYIYRPRFHLLCIYYAIKMVYFS